MKHLRQYGTKVPRGIIGVGDKTNDEEYRGIEQKNRPWEKIQEKNSKKEKERRIEWKDRRVEKIKETKTKRRKIEPEEQEGKSNEIVKESAIEFWLKEMRKEAEDGQTKKRKREEEYDEETF